MKIYRLRHKPTGLYYQPVRGRWIGGKTNLSKKGKIYQSNQNALNGNGDTITINVSGKQYKSHKEIFDSLGIYDSDYRYYYVSYHTPEYILRCKKTDFEKEYITNDED